ncbi:hypothetical protein QN277_008298 [Acacia crassicarpa]|uniref:Transcription repressor n=1 Tax=Acacia crassicarpa TaxID=499986 RepID=A0AAE1ISW2_9FABA|nr:hypothetical protein QN277_008298 [Acacia crassicarpa]
MSSHKRTLLRILLTVNGSCCCGRPKPTDVFEPKPKHQMMPNPIGSRTSSTATSDGRNYAHSEEDDNDGVFTPTTVSEAETESQRNLLPKRSPIVDSVAVEKESEDPYKDFRHSMLQMIFEKEMSSESDLKELLEAFLQLNSPRQHDVILKAFSEICGDAFPHDHDKKTTSKNKSKQGMTCYGQVRSQPLARA